MDMLDLKTGHVCKTFIPKVAEGIFDVVAMFNATNEYVLYYHSGKKTIRLFRRSDGEMIANFRVQADLKGMETTTDGRSVVLGMGDGSMTTLTIADPNKDDVLQYLKSLPSRNPVTAHPSGSESEDMMEDDGHEATSEVSSGSLTEKYLQNGVEYPSPYDFPVYTSYLRSLERCIPGKAVAAHDDGK